MLPLFAPLIQLFLTVYYFFYFLAKGKPEWKCEEEKHGGETAHIEKVCCDEAPPSSLYTPLNQRRGIRATLSTIPMKMKMYWRRFVDWLRSLRSPSFTARSLIRRLSNGIRRMGACAVSLLQATWQIISTFFTTLFSFLLFRRAPSKTMPTSDVIYSSHEGKDVKRDIHPVVATPVPFSLSSPSTSCVPPPPPPPPPARPTTLASSHGKKKKEEEIGRKEDDGSSLKGGAFYSTRVFSSDKEEREEWDRGRSRVRDAIKGGVAVFPPSMMAEIAGSGGGGEEVKKSEVNREINRTVKERLREASLTPTTKTTFEYSFIPPVSRAKTPMEYSMSNSVRVDTPKGWGERYEDEKTRRAKSVGAPRVSRIEDSATHEAQFIFRAHGEEERDCYGIGGSLYQPVDWSMKRSMDSRATTPSIWSCDSRRETPGPYSRGEEDGVRHRGQSSRGKVGAKARQWPPPTNAEGADIGKEYFVDGNGVVTTACTRIVQKKNEESWRLFDDSGKVMDEKSEYSMMGNRDELRRGGPYEANHYSEHYFIDRDGTTRFENTHRQYDRDYVIESVCRNY